ncbi:uncharacterized protein TNIN_158131 [Trichonephila inaurata madagascariensis]|uniref:Uncharacterized protein n=1 Tax=Trichonephila inaurata madagascariensis TaxID=2747483 RepID=A0A8X6JPK1_9ARAC|nr:uncharacterized protein TNIN_158131 [Trichonephila inaurata madagascariensis]
MEDEKSFSYIWSPRDDKDRTFKSGSFNKFKTSHRSNNDKKDAWDSSNVQNYFKNEDEYLSDESLDKYNSETFGNFDAIPEEFRPNGKGTNLFKVQTSPKKEAVNITSETKSNFGLPFDNQPNGTGEKVKGTDRHSLFASYKKACNNFNSGRGKSESQDNQQKKEFFFTSENSEKRERFNEKYFYNYESQKRSHFDKDTLFVKEEVKAERRKNFRDTENPSPKYTPNITAKKLEETTNEPMSRGNGRQKFTKKITIEKCVSWKDDLCKFQIPNRKPNFSYKFTSEITSDEYLPSDSRFPVTKEEQTPHKFKTKHHFYSGEENLDSKSDTDSLKQPGKSSKDKKSFSHGANKSKVMQSRNLNTESRVRFSNTGNNIKTKNYPFRNANPRIPVIRHEVKVIHVNAPSHIRKTYPDTRRVNNQKKFEGKSYQHRKANEATKKYPIKGNIKWNANYSESTENLNISNDSEINKKSKVDEFQKKESTTTYEVMEKMESLSLEKKIPNSTQSTPKTGDVNLLISYGKDISDIIVGSYVALNTLLAIYDKWFQHRLQTMTLFDELEKNLSQYSNRNKMIKDIAALINASTNVLHFVPNPTVALTGKIVASLSSIVSQLFSSSPKMKNYVLNDFELRLCLQEDVDSTSEIYMHCMQCNHQFQDACKLIEEFHYSIQNGGLKEYVKVLDTGFLKEMSEFNPKSPDVYYRRLERCYGKLFKNQATDVDEAFCRAFEDWPEAITVISLLPNRFNMESWDCSAVVRAWEEIYELFLDENSLISDVLKKIQDCILLLIKERSVMEKYAAILQKRL